MKQSNNLKRFLDAQETDFSVALSEIKNGQKRSHWMWYIFPQIQGLGYSEMSKLYAIKDLCEAVEFLQHPLLGNRLVSICNELLALKSNDAHLIFGSPDDFKLKSCLTLFAAVNNSHPVFQLVLDKYFNGIKDHQTLDIIAGLKDLEGR
jgi:uncharacterized protein (DUF1810 family)